MIAMVTCHDLGTDKTLLDSGLGEIHCSWGSNHNLAFNQPPAGSTGEKRTQTKPNNKTAEGSIQLKIKGNMK